MSVWDDIKNRLKIEDIISDYLEIVPSGAYYKCACPFHNEKTPSLMINPDKGIWHCFGCGAGGDMFVFVQNYENITAKETLEKLAKKAQITLEKSKSSSSDKNTSNTEKPEVEAGFEILSWSSDIYHKVLLKLLTDRSHPITKYCIDRGLSQDIINEFKIGYAPKNNIILQLSKKYSLDSSLLQKTGLLKLSDQNTLKDKFLDRLMIPIADYNGKIVGFTARTVGDIDNSKRPKYLNSPASLWFNKSELWFGLNLARRSLFQAKKAILVEGNMDVIASFNHDITNVIASQGTSVTSDQLAILWKITKHILIAFDNDNAGKLAGEKLFKQAVAIGFIVDKIVIPTKYKDIDEYLSSSDYDPVKGFKSISYMSYILDTYKAELINNTTNTKKRTIEHVLDLFATTDPISAELYINELSEISSINKETLFSLYNALYSKNNKVNGGKNTSAGDTSQNQLNSIPNKSYLRVAFQKLLLTNTSHELLEKLFILLQIFVEDFNKSTTFQDYLTKMEPELDLMSESGNYKAIDAPLLIDSLLLFLDQNLSKFILDTKLKEIYQELKKY
jgi:DNA primase